MSIQMENRSIDPGRGPGAAHGGNASGPRLKWRLLLLALGVLNWALVAEGHYAGRLGVDNYVCITPREHDLEVLHDIHLGEIPAAALIARLDTDRSGTLEPAEMAPYFRQSAIVYADGLKAQVRVGGQAIDMKLSLPPGGLDEHCHARIVRGANEERTFRFTWTFRADWPEAVRTNRIFMLRVHRPTYRSLNRPSWIFAHGRTPHPVRILRADVPGNLERPLPPDITDTITNPDLLPADSSATLLVSLDGSDGDPSVPEAPSAGTVPPAGEGGGGTSGEQGMTQRENRLRARIFNMVRSAKGPGSFSLIVLLCFGWGALHAFGPGHGKTIAGTYLISARASYGDAILLGTLMTITHTAVILILAVAATILKDRFVYPTWLQPVGAILILVVGVRQITVGLRRALGLSTGHAHHHGHTHPHGHSHDHDHPHDHPHPHQGEAAVTRRDIGTLGLSGGMVPCPAAIVLLLLAWQVGMPVFGLVCIVAFSLGLALTLIAVGVLAISGTRLVLKWVSKPDEEHDHHAVIGSLVPIVGGVLLLIFGIIVLLG
jgi:ABC-type nickel/cobalt efflux system permease component RcnA